MARSTFALTAGPDGSLWIAVPGQGSVLRYEPSGHITVYVVSADGWQPDALQFAPDGTLWVGASPPQSTPGADGRVYHITP